MFHMPEWLTYATMPVIAAIIGWVTKVAAVEMMFKPVEFKGIPPYLGWQGVIPRSAARMASISVDLMMRRILRPEELIGLINVDELMVTLQEPMAQMIDEMTREIMLEFQPTLWEALPEVARRTLIRRIQGQVPSIMQRMLDEMKDHVEDVIDIRSMAVEAMIRDKALTNRLVRAAGKDAFSFIIRFGIPSGLLLGGLQAVVWALTKNVWVIPSFGAIIGLSTDWLALQMIFRPVYRRRYLGILSWQGLFHAKRETVTRDYAALMANELMSPANLFEAMVNGPGADRFIALIDREINSMIDSRSGPMKPLLVLAIGGGTYSGIKRRASEAVITQMRANPELAIQAASSVNLQGFLEEKMALMTSEEYEDLLRPAFKQDEWKIVVVGAVLGFLVGELQVHLLLT